MSSPIQQSDVLPDFIATQDQFVDIPEIVHEKHVVYLVTEYGGGERIPIILAQIIADELSKLGIDHEVSSRPSRSKARKSPRSNKDYSNGINRVVEIQLRSCGTKIQVPFIVKETCSFIRKHITEEGILRKSGSSARAACIMQRFLSPESEDYFSTFDTVHDVANVLKQYLRQLHVPLIPQTIQNVFIQCLELPSESSRIQSLMMASCLIPPQTVGVLSYVMEFLADVAYSSKDNKMTCENLAIVMGPNIMPVDHRKNERVIQKSERHVLDLHNKVVEILIKNADSVGQVNNVVERRLEAITSLRSSEDELENDRVGRRKKRRSGSLNRMLGFLKKVTNGKSGGETPTIPSTPVGDSFSHTPIIKGSSRKKTMEDNLFSMHKKKSILDGVRKNGFHFNKDDTSGTPNTTGAAFTACPSPAICLNPSPMNWKQTPNGNILKNFVTPSLLRRRDRCLDSDKNVFSAPVKSSKPRLRFGKKGSKKQENETQTLLQKGSQETSSSISIHKLANSPRATLQRNPSSRIPRPDKLAIPLRKNTSSSKLYEDNAVEKPAATPDSINCSEGEYVTISASAELSDIKNEAFIASSVSLTDSEYEPINRKLKDETEFSILFTDESICDTEKFATNTAEDSTFNIPNKLQLTPLIQEIDSLTRTAQDLSLSTTLKAKSASSIRGVQSCTLPQSPTELNTTPLHVDLVENKFIRTVKETKIIQIKSENTSKPSNLIHRRLSIQDRRMSPSQRKISSARRKSHEIGDVKPVVTKTRFMSLRSPRNLPLIQIQPCSTLKRSPTRCTLKRGRPNTARAGLARPSPVRNTPRIGLTNRSQTESKNIIQQKEENQRQTPLRRMSSVQELVKKLEKNRKENKNLCSQDSVIENGLENSNSVPLLGTVLTPAAAAEPTIQFQIQTRSKSRQKNASIKLSQEVSDQNEVNWVAAHKFGFDRKDIRGLQGGNADRDSIHFLKTLHAGKVPATVEYFNKIGKHTNKSPRKSLIPRYTALHLHQSEGSKNNLECTTPNQKIMSLNATITDRISRRLSLLDVRQKHEQLLENIKQERSVKRSATTAGSYQSNKNQLLLERRVLRDKPQLASNSYYRNNCIIQRPTMLIQ